jgi:hypothetical protein
MFILIFTGCTRMPSASTSNTDDDNQIRNRISTLLTNNLECINVYFLDGLDCDFEDTSKPMFRVTSDKFHSFDELKAFVNDTYISEVANRLLYNTMGEGHPLYFDMDGVFYSDESGFGNVESYDWSHYTFTYSDIDSSSKLVTISLMAYAGDDFISATPEPATITIKVVLENGVWKLSHWTEF